MKRYWSLSESPISDEAQIFEYINDVPFAHFTIGSTVYARRIVESLNSASELLKENEQLKRLLHDLTPGGSEFYNDPEYCAKWIRESRQENHYQLGGIIKETKKENEQLKEQLETGANQYAKYVMRNEELKEQVKVLRDVLEKTTNYLDKGNSIYPNDIFHTGRNGMKSALNNTK